MILFGFLIYIYTLEVLILYIPRLNPPRSYLHRYSDYIHVGKIYLDYPRC